MSKTANLYARIEPNVKIEAEAILSELGITTSNAINIFYKQIILQGGLPFSVKLPPHPVDVDNMSQTQFEIEIEKGINDVDKGNIKSADVVFSNIHKKYGI